MTTPQLQCDDPLARRWYARLRHDGTTDVDIDSGYGQAVASDNAFHPKRQIVGAKDGTITCSEITEAVFARAATYRALIQKDTGYPVSWLFETATERRLRPMIRALQSIVAALWKPGTENYNADLGMALYYFAFMPKKTDLVYFQRYQSAWLDAIAWRLQTAGLVDVVSLVLKEGGLGLRAFQGDAPLEATASEALAMEKGLCTEKVKMLTALFFAAGLSPFVYQMSIQEAMRAFSEAFGNQIPFQATPDEEFMGHVTTGLQIAPNATATFEFQRFGGNILLINMSFKPFAERLSWREFFQIDLANHAGNLRATGKHAEAARDLSIARRLGPSYLDPWLSRVGTELAKGTKDWTTATHSVEAGLRILPNDPWLYTQQCEIFQRTDRLPEAIACYTTVANQLDVAKVYLVECLLAQKTYDQAVPYLDQLVTKGYHVGKYAHQLGAIYAMRKEFEKAITSYTLATDAEPENAAHYEALGAAYAAVGAQDKALTTYQRALLLRSDPTERIATYTAIVPLLAASGQLPLAKHYFAALLAVLSAPSQWNETVALHRNLVQIAGSVNGWDALLTMWSQYGATIHQDIVATLLIDILWRSGQSEKALQLAAELPIAKPGWDQIECADMDASALIGWDQALQLFPETFWPKAPQTILQFYKGLGRCYEATGAIPDTIRAWSHYLKYATAPDAEIRTRLQQLRANPN